MNALRKIVTPGICSRAIGFWKRYGTKNLVLSFATRLSKYDILYEQWDKQNRLSSQELEAQRQHSFTYSPKISIIVPTFNTPLDFLKNMVESVLAQTYKNWELCIADGASSDNTTKKTLKKYSNGDARIKVVFLDKNLQISGNTNAGLDIATGEYVSFMDHDDTLAPNALYEAVKALQNNKYDFMYSDEDMVSANLKRKVTAVLKPDFSPQLLECHNYITHMVFVKRELYEKVGNLNSKYDGAQDYDFVLRCTDAAKSIYHIPHILYHWRTHPGSVAGDAESKMYAYDAGLHALEDHFVRIGVDADVNQANLLGYYKPTYKVKNNPLLSIVIPNKDQADILERCINSLYNNNDYQNFEIVIVENNSREQQTFEFYNKLESNHANLKVVKFDGKFNYSKINNFGVSNTKGEYLLLLNNDTETIGKDAISQMLGMITQLPDVGIVGAKLYYPDNTIQHAGTIVGFNGFAGHVFRLYKKEADGYMNRLKINVNYSAVTAACMMVSKSDYDAAGGFSEDFEVAINDVDFCMKIRQADKLIVCNNFSEWYHYESISRGDDEKDKGKFERFCKERKLFQKRWPEILKNGDPFYNANLTYDRRAFSFKV